MKQLRHLTLKTVGEVIEALGGPTQAGRVVGKTPQSMTNAKMRNRLPSNCYLIMTRQLARMNYVAPPALWGIQETPRRRKRA